MRYHTLPEQMKTEEVQQYYHVLLERRAYLSRKKAVGRVLAAVILLVLLPLLLGIAVCISLDSPGPVLFRQTRVTQYGKRFTIYKFRTMKWGEEGGEITGSKDPRVTRAGQWLRRSKLDELPQLWNIVRGEMCFVGPRPEVPCFVERYTGEMQAVLLVPAGLTSWASLLFCKEEELLTGPKPEQQYEEQILPQKIEMDLAYLNVISPREDGKILFNTWRAVSGALFKQLRWRWHKDQRAKERKSTWADI